jgi:hypothetical protein
VIHRIGATDRVRRLVLEGPHRGDWVEMNQLLHHLILLEPVDTLAHILGDEDRERIIYRHAAFAARVGDEVWVVEGYVPDTWSPVRIPRLAMVGFHAIALLSS